MTTSHLDRTTSHRDLRLLRQFMVDNAAFSALCGAALLVGSVPLSERLGPPAWLLALLGVGLGVYAVDLTIAVRRPALTVLAARLAVVADASWVIGAIAVIAATDWLTTSGEVALGAVTAVVAVLGLGQWFGLKRA